MSILRKSILAATLAATAIATTTPAMANDYRRHGSDDTAAIAIGAGVIGLALGAIIASSDNDRDRYRDRGYAAGPAYSSSWYYRDGWYWDRDGRRHSRAEYNRHSRHGEYRRDDYGRRGYDRDPEAYRRGY